ncbi:putative methanogenesis marker protein 7 [Methanosarcina lacustris Z-7289]|uniref:Putative methanogenesis marker protein 7 n=1 Tax=Methanosarcina lacustris Z-7289 TaxID=1434111 RepID=A0A0E3S3X2_9EURY|nr:methanogenesis marker 7 protein [Methanosarcina lacustris]AKB73817.1 putative methanogenesis marker protein 7 [Methanosarcina lacustris Z-7289]
MVVLLPYLYTGGVHKHGLLVELMEDLGGYIIQKVVSGIEVNLIMLIPEKDIDLVKQLSAELLGVLMEAPLTGVEIAVVSPTLASHHLPHSACDIAEYLRHPGANTNMIGLARGMGRRVSLSMDYERKLINEHDIAVFTFGSFSDCITKKKPKLFEGIEIPIVVTGGPAELKTEDVPGADLYVGNIGRVSHRLRRTEEINALDNLNEGVSKIAAEIRQQQAKDPLAVLPARVMKEIENQVPEIRKVLSPAPLTVQLDGLRVKLPYDEFHEKIEKLEFDEGVSLSELANISRSKMKNYILIKIKYKSDVGFAI